MRVEYFMVLIKLILMVGDGLLMVMHQLLDLIIVLLFHHLNFLVMIKLTIIILLEQNKGESLLMELKFIEFLKQKMVDIVLIHLFPKLIGLLKLHIMRIGQELKCLIKFVKLFKLEIIYQVCTLMEILKCVLWLDRVLQQPNLLIIISIQFMFITSLHY
uniref:ORF2a n=1 Tax=Solenopsis invicta virus 3 TaxID=631345 RepID=A0A2D1LXS4_SINV3|nr:ORF2a [Solenopsis invicta virus 3]